MSRKRLDVWTTYATTGFDGPHGSDRRADGCVTLRQVRRKTVRERCVLVPTPTYRWVWQERRVNVNGCFSSEGEPWDISSADGMKLWERVKRESP